MKMLDELTEILNSYGIKTILYIDRLHLYLDSSTPKSNLIKLLSESDEIDLDADDEIHNKLIFQQLPKYPHLDRKLELFQPDITALNFLNNTTVVCGDCRIQYVEFALDFEASISDGANILKKLEEFFDKHMVDEQSVNSKERFYWAKSNGKKDDSYSKDEWKWKMDYEGTRYFAPRNSRNVLVMYRREVSKINTNKSCLHLEWRFSGLAQLKEQGIITLQQLIDFDHLSFWNNKLDLRQPNFEALGKLFVLQTLTRQAYYKRGKKEWSKIPALQQFLQAQPDSSSALTPITTRTALNKLLKPFLTK